MFQPRTLPRTLSATQRDMQHAAEHVRVSALVDLVRLARAGEALAVDELCRVLVEDPSERLRAEAALGLADAGARERVPELVVHLQGASPRVREMLLLAVGELADASHRPAVDAVEAALDDPHPRVRFQALATASRLELTSAMAARERALTDADAEVRYLALRLVASDGLGGAAVEPLLDDGVVQVRVAAAMLLAPEPRMDKARAEIAAALNSGLVLPEPADRQELIEMAGALGVTAAIPGLRREAYGRMGLGGGPFAWQAEIALARLGDARASRGLAKGLVSRSRNRRTLAALGCARAGLIAERWKIAELGDNGDLDADVVKQALFELDGAALP